MTVRSEQPRTTVRALARIWSSSPDARRFRRPTDVLLLLSSLLFLGLLSLPAPGPSGADDALATLLTWLEPVFGWLWSVVYALLALWGLWLVLLPAASRGRRRLLVDQAAAAVLALAGATLVGALVGTDPSDTIHALVASGPPVVYVASRIAVLTAVVVVASPHLARPWRYASRLVIGLGALAAIGLGTTNLLGAAAAIAVGTAAAAITHLLLGTPQGRLTDEQVQVALADLGVPVTRVAPAPTHGSASTVLLAETADGTALRVTVYGRDAWDSQVAGSLWTALTRRGGRAHVGSSRRSRVEHEALLTLLAAQVQVPTLDVVAVGVAVQRDALLVTSNPATTLAELEPEQLTDALLGEMWQAVVRLNRAGIAHGQIDGNRVVIRTDGTAALADFDAARQAADEGDLRTDQARLLVATSLVVDPDRAVAAAVATLGTDGLAEVLPYLQSAALGRDTRTDLREENWSLKELRATAVAAAGVEEPPLERLRRVTPRSIGVLVVVALVVYFVVTLLTGVDFASVADALTSANWAWVLAALLLTPVIQVSSAGATLGATLARLRYLPVLMLQYAIQFIALVIPASAARLALEVRFFQKFGIPAAAAVSFGVIDSVSGFVVQMVLIVVILVSGLPGFTEKLLTGPSEAESGETDPGLLAVLAGLLLVVVIVTVAVPRLRRRVREAVPRIRSALTEQARAAQSTLGVLRRPDKVAAMLGGNLGVQLLQACVLALCLHAFGESAHFSQLILINTAVSLFSGLMPIPGGMGVAEAGFTLGLQAIGIPSAIAVSTAITFRLVTFYLPPIWGAPAMRWLRRREYV
ncbi:lysylphosphatidylglycerol synthase transmembrane domain-containing protein [Cellulomonas edaphi]|uniref:Lysylphosphatidylglycerol synthase transmembrane domain-containing protein n=1 Tax=Cellulomonas edaphi TaxID=3053468 RepID=A0ABT7S2J4_9CELL|nr:lysylphosphatidylglycerol synthase transmembrane domain-containing protein [Cellulomons edaphi]MDM7829836.1 lysylphosphatidylglycerol synthase transmembrane domain-containing protein [Cellulomons edaphi]